MSRDVFRFIEMGTELVELETGYSENEPMGYATKAAIEESVYNLIQIGIDEELWDISYEENT